MRMDIEKTLTEFIQSEIAYGGEQTRVDRDEQLLDGIVDSTDLLRLVAFIEERFGIRVGDDELVPENFETIARLAAFISAKREASAA